MISVNYALRRDCSTVVIVPQMVKAWLNGLRDSQPTVPQPRKIKGLELYAPEPAFARCKTE